MSVSLCLGVANKRVRLATPEEAVAECGQGLPIAHLRAQLEDLQERIAHVRAQLEHRGDTFTG
jgi:hypothetical protein